jgi:hypothetical protein
MMHVCRLQKLKNLTDAPPQSARLGLKSRPHYPGIPLPHLQQIGDESCSASTSVTYTTPNLAISAQKIE